MAARVDASKILRKLRMPKANKGKVSLYINKDIYEEFQKICGKEGVAAGETIDELMASFIESQKQSGTDK